METSLIILMTLAFCAMLTLQVLIYLVLKSINSNLVTEINNNKAYFDELYINPIKVNVGVD